MINFAPLSSCLNDEYTICSIARDAALATAIVAAAAA